MGRFLRILISAFVLLLPGWAGAAPKVVQLEISGAIGPATADYFHRGLERARDSQAAMVVLRMDTPGGLDVAMRDIIKDILASSVPVATWVAPSGARAASAGAYILLASHVAAMAPATNAGAATPVQIGGIPDPGGGDRGDAKPSKSGPKPGMEEKVLNDAIAYIRGLAELRGRNVQWAERAVREAISTSAEEAVRINIADFIAADLDEVIQKADGRTVKLPQGSMVLSIKGATVDMIAPDWRNRLLAVITDPNVAYILMLLGIYGLFFELWNPGYVLPGVIGGICLLLALYAFQVLPINYAGLGLIILGIAFIVAEVFLPSFGALGIGGAIAFVAGSIILIDTGDTGLQIARPLIGGLALVTSALLFSIVWMAMRARRRKVVSGAEEMIGAEGVVLASAEGGLRVRVHGEDWSAQADTRMTPDRRIRVVRREGLTLVVEPWDESQEK